MPLILSFFFKTGLVMLVPLHLYMNFRIIYMLKYFAGIFIRIVLNLYINLKSDILNLHYVESSHTWTCYVFHIFRLSLTLPLALRSSQHTSCQHNKFHYIYIEIFHFLATVTTYSLAFLNFSVHVFTDNRNIIHFCKFISYPATLLNSLINFRSFLK